MTDNDKVLNLTSLPEELLLFILSKIDNPQDFIKTSQANKQLYRLSYDESLFFRQKINRLNNLKSRIENSKGYIKNTNYEELEKLLKEQKYIGAVATKFEENNKEIIYGVVGCCRIANYHQFFRTEMNSYIQYKIKINKETENLECYIIESLGGRGETIEVLLENEKFLLEKLDKTKQCENVPVYQFEPHVSPKKSQCTLI